MQPEEYMEAEGLKAKAPEPQFAYTELKQPRQKVGQRARALSWIATAAMTAALIYSWGVVGWWTVLIAVAVRLLLVPEEED